jgi:hypothetical protein
MQRRSETRGGGSERRVIERFSDARITQTLQQIRVWVLVLCGLFFLSAIGELAIGFWQGPSQGVFAFFISTFLIIFGIILFQYAGSIQFFLKNESVTNLYLTIDRQLMFWKVMGIFALLFAIIFVVFKI